MNQQPGTTRGVRRLAYFALAGSFLLIGLIGVVLPGIPTTPFLLLMSFFLVRASPKVHELALRIPVIGQAIQDWDENHGVRSGTKLVACTMVLVALGISMISQQMSIPVKSVITVFGFVGLVVIWRLPTVS